MVKERIISKINVFKHRINTKIDVKNMLEKENIFLNLIG